MTLSTASVSVFIPILTFLLYEVGVAGFDLCRVLHHQHCLFSYGIETQLCCAIILPPHHMWHPFIGSVNE